MLKRITYLLLLCFAASLAYSASAQLTQPQTVKDYYLLLPEKYFWANQAERIDWMLDPKRGAVVDTKNGYLYAPGDGAQTDIWVCLSKDQMEHTSWALRLMQEILMTSHT